MQTYPNGLDCVWLATDRNGHLGAFVTGGIGPIPKSVLSSASVSIENIEEMVCALPQVSDVRLLVKMKRPDDFVEMAQRGLFVYDWCDVHRTASEFTHAYEPIAVPLNPISANLLPEVLMKVALATKLINVAFVEMQVLNIAAVLECCDANH
ncbi:hypothetical protein [Chitinivorax sp. B]|uniref:hypothetical protein n=1 Tax=Chitinivorax sp. B TaxID=2502235 RepID=UPI0010F69813|nr:hypothetical protein [Chitinivorax sp. B]